MRPEQAPGWKNWFFYQDHRPDEALLARVPAVRAAVERVGREQLDRFEIHLSVLEPGAHIPPHCGGGNAKLTLHLPLRIPEGDTAIRVAGEARGWREGEVLIFDDSFVHEAWNRTRERRAVLLLTAYHPDLSIEEIGVMEMLEPINVEVYREYLRRNNAAA
jgi:aspartyl/asparaginyl beta-hydroxylase (cupin superfamily)